VIWYAAKGAQDIYAASIAYSVLIQEICRWGFYTLINKAESGLNIVSANPSSPFNRPIFAFGKYLVFFVGRSLAN
jgi:anterior pharynx defective protein 1